MWDESEDQYIYASEEFANIHGLTVDEVLTHYNTALSDLELIHPDDRQRYSEVYENDPGEVYECEYRLIRKDGDIRHVHEFGQRIGASPGRNAQSLGILQDITDHKRDGEAVRNSESLLKQAAQLANMGHYLFDGEKRQTVFVSEEFAEIFGLSVDEILSAYKNSDQEDLLIHPDDRDRVMAAYEQADLDVASHDVEYRIIRRDGEQRFIRDLGEPLFDQEGQYRQTIGVVQDVTEQLTAQFALEQSEVQFKEAEQIGRVGHYQYDEINAKYLGASEEFARIHGYELGDLQEKFPSLLDLVHPDDYERVRQSYLDCSPAFEYRIMHPDGGVRYIRETTEYFFEDDADKPYESHGTVQDVTEQRLVQQALEESETRFKEAEKIGRMGHYLYDEVNGNYLSVSDQFAQFHGYGAEELLEKYPSLMSLVHPDDRERVRQSYIDCETLLEYRNISADGSVLYVRETTEYFYKDGADKPYESHGTILDITEQRLAQLALEQSEQVLKQAARISKQGYAHWDDIKKEYISVSAEYAQIFGYTAEEFLARFRSLDQDMELIHPDDRAEVLVYNESPEAIGEAIEYRILHRDGTVRHVKEITQDILADEGKSLE